MAEVTLTVNHESGLHARPLAQFVKTVKQFDCTVEVSNVTSGKGPARGDSPLKLMMLAVTAGSQIHIAAEGGDADQAVQALVDLVENDFKLSE